MLANLLNDSKRPGIGRRRCQVFDRGRRGVWGGATGLGDSYRVSTGPDRS